MNDTDAKIKQQIVEKIKVSTNILVTVSRDPSVDELSAAIGLNALLNKQDKHATAIFSGNLPSAINFLNPEKVFENTADSLRDFIIALDKEKADHLRYKVEGDVVKIFITPYRTTITSSDLEFSQGDFNVELVLALGVENREHLDAAITAHGGILDGVTVVTLSDGMQTSDLGDLNWNDKNASCLSEMVVSIADALKVEKTDKILDKQISTALLTGVVAATDRFSNTRTTSRIMTIAAQLMAAGADQQLIAAKLQESHEIKELKPASAAKEIVPADVIKPTIELDSPFEPEPEPTSTLPPKDSLVIHHEDENREEPVVGVLDSTLPPAEDLSLPKPEELPSSSEASTLPPINNDLKFDTTNDSFLSEASSTLPIETSIEPSLGGTLSATAEQAAEDARRDIEDDKNKTILSHAYLGDNDNDESGENHGGDSIDILADNSLEKADEHIPTVSQPTFGGERVIQPPSSLEDLPLPPPLPDFSTLPPPAIPDLNMPYPSAMPTPVNNPMPSSTPTPNPTGNISDPTQFRIPGQ